MKLDELEANNAYDAILRWLKNPNADISTSITEARRPRLRQQLELLRKGQETHLVRFAISPRIDTFLAQEGQEVHELNTPRKVAAQFMDEMLRDIRVSGLWSSAIRRENESLSVSDEGFVNLLQWMMKMQDLPKDIRNPWDLALAFSSPVAVFQEGFQFAGPVMSGFLIYYYILASYPSRPEWLVEFPIDQQATLSIVRIQSLFLNEPVRVSTVWAHNVLVYGAKRISKFAGESTSDEDQTS